MPNKKGSKIAASKARAQANAKKKAHQGGPVLAAAAYTPPPPKDEEAAGEMGGAAGEAAPDAAAGAASDAGSVATAAPPVAAPARAPRGVRRERAHQAPSVPSVSLRREVGLIGGLTVVVGAILVGLRLFTDLGA